MAGPTPIQGIQPLGVLDDPTPYASPEQRSGGTADPRHGQVGEVAQPYPWNVTGGVQFTGSHGPYGIENEILGFDYMEDVVPHGTLSQDPTADMTPASAAGGRKTHAAPWPKGVSMSDGPDAISDQLLQSRNIHASDTGASRNAPYIPTMDAHQDEWRDFYEVNPGASLQAPLARATRAQVGASSGGIGSYDRAQSLRQQNEYGFDAAHMHRRYAAGPIPGNYMWLQPGGRPMHRNLPGTAQLATGSDSPFTGDDTGAAFGQYGAVLSQLPGEYQAPPEPALSRPIASGEDSEGVDLW